MIRDERGAVLLEALVALTLLTAAAGGVITLLASATTAAHDTAAREAAIHRAERVLLATSLLSRRELELRLGERGVGELVVTVGRPEPSLFRIAVSEQRAPARELLVTVVHRPLAGAR